VKRTNALKASTRPLGAAACPRRLSALERPRALLAVRDPEILATGKRCRAPPPRRGPPSGFSRARLRSGPGLRRSRSRQLGGVSTCEGWRRAGWWRRWQPGPGQIASTRPPWRAVLEICKQLTAGVGSAQRRSLPRSTPCRGCHRNVLRALGESSGRYEARDDWPFAGVGEGGRRVIHLGAQPDLTAPAGIDCAEDSRHRGQSPPSVVQRFTLDRDKGNRRRRPASACAPVQAG
jgi:hypothetical protein